MEDSDTTKEARYEQLVKAVSGGELTMVKFLWNLVEKINSIIEETPQVKLAKMQREAEAIIKHLKDNPPQRGRPGVPGATPTDKQLLKLIRPLIPKPIPGRPGVDGKEPSAKRLVKLIRPLIPKPVPGKMGAIPDHEWKGTKIRFELPDGTWGDWVDLRGKTGSPGESFGPSDVAGGVSPGLHRVRADGFTREGVSEIYFGDNLTITRTNNGVRIDAEAGASSGTGLDFETPTGTVDDSNVTFTATETPLYLVVNGAQYFENVHYTLSGLEITLNNPVGTGGFIRSAYGSGITVETPTGTVDDSNTSFTVSNQPKYIVINGAQYFDGAGYSYSGGTITLVNPVGTGGFIRSVY